MHGLVFCVSESVVRLPQWRGAAVHTTVRTVGSAKPLRNSNFRKTTSIVLMYCAVSMDGSISKLLVYLLYIIHHIVSLHAVIDQLV
jgi:hypothetical protein